MGLDWTCWELVESEDLSLGLLRIGFLLLMYAYTHVFSLKFSYECVALATSKQLIEVSISNLLSPADWLFDDFEYDLEVMRK